MPALYTSALILVALAPALAFLPAVSHSRTVSHSSIAAAYSRAGRAAIGMAAEETFKPNLMKPNIMVEVFSDGDALSAAVCDAVKVESAKAIAAKGSFSMAIPSGSVVKALTGLSAGDCDFSKFHVFFTNENLGKFKSYAQCLTDLAEPCGIPLTQIYKHAEGDKIASAAAYAKLLVDCEATAVEQAASRSAPGTTAGAVDLVLLGTGDDGHCASLYPGSPELAKTGSGEMVLAKAEEDSITVSIDFINAAGKVVLGAAEGKRADMVLKALKEGKRSGMPTGFVDAKDTVWLVDSDSIASYKAA